MIPVSLSDHDAVSITIENKSIERGPGYYKLNDSLLSEEPFLRAISETVKTTKEKYQQYLDPQMFWDLCKIKLAETAKLYSRERSFRNKKECQNVTVKLKEAQLALSQNPESREMKNRYESLRKAQELYLNEEARGAQIWSKINWVERGERNTSFFLGLEKNKAKRKEIHSLS